MMNRLKQMSSRLTLLLLFPALILGSCSDVEFNNPAFQADLNYELWRATAYNASYDDFGNLVITGANSFETVILTLTSNTTGTFELGPEQTSKAEFIDGFGTRFSTAIVPDEEVSIYTDLGRVELTQVNGNTNTFTGRFYFEAFDAQGQNPQALSNGVFFEVKLKEN